MSDNKEIITLKNENINLRKQIDELNIKLEEARALFNFKNARLVNKNLARYKIIYKRS